MSKVPFGILILHGFADNTDAVSKVEQPLRVLQLPIHMPLLRGHGADSPEALRGVTWHDWVADGETALQSLSQEVDKAIIIGHSVGALVAVHLSAEHPDTIDSTILAAAPIIWKSPMAPGRPLHFLVPLIVRLFKKLSLPPAYTDTELAKQQNCYHWAPPDAIASVLEFSVEARKILPQIKTPMLILQSRKDSSVSPTSAEIIYNSIATTADKKRIFWFYRTDHEMFCDCEHDAVAAVITDYVRERIGSC